MILDVDYNQQWFLHVPFPHADEGDPRAREWARDSVETFNVVAEWADPCSRDELVETVLAQSTLFTTDAATAFLYCPRGLPATAVLEIALAQAEGDGALAALDREPVDETALPRQVVDVSARHLGEGVLVHGLATAGDDGQVAIATYSFVREGRHVLVTVTSPDINAITLGRPHFDELVDAISVSD